MPWRRPALPDERVVHAVALALAALAAAVLYVRVQFRYPDRPHVAPTLADFALHHTGPDPRFGWWAWADQGRYLDAALAWAHGDLDPAHHWYPPGYPLLGAVFSRITPVQPFLIPDLLCLLAALGLFSLIARRLAPSLRYAEAAGAAVFTLCAVVQPRALTSWAIPWTSTPETVLILAALLAAGMFMDRPRPAPAFWAAGSASAILGFRPADAACVAAVVGIAMLAALAMPTRHASDGSPGGGARPAWATWRRCIAAACAGAAIPLLVFGAAHLAVYGWAAGGYVHVSQRIGFEWRLLAQRWVTIVVDPRPLFPTGQGLSSRFWWLMPGLAGMATCLLAPTTQSRRFHLCVAALVLADGAMILSYRDLHQAGLWRYENHHYFKWLMPLLGFYAVLLLRALANRRTAPLAAAALCVVFAGLFMWRAEAVELATLPPARDDGGVRLDMPDGPPALGEAIVVALQGTWQAIYFGRHDLRTAARNFESDSDFKAIPLDGETLVQPLREMGHAPGTLIFGPGIRLPASGAPPPRMMRVRLRWALPCWFPLPGCRPIA